MAWVTSGTVILSAALALTGGISISAETKPAEPAQPEYKAAEAVKTIINPHEQINDEGEILWDRCIICHRNVPDISREKSVKDVKLRFEDDSKELCYRCHPVRKHPEAQGASVMMSGIAAPDHMVAPSKTVRLNMRLIMKEIPTILPLDQKSGKVTCYTCHNPHERGVLVGKANWGADSSLRLRTEVADICQFCHRK